MNNQRILDQNYMAGIADGESSMYVSRHVKNNKKEYRCHFAVAMNDRHSLEVFQKYYGGNIRVGHKRLSLDSKNQEYARAYVLSYSSIGKVKEIIWDLLPYLRVKKEQALVILDFISLKENEHDFNPLFVGGQKHNFYKKLKALKKKNWVY